MTPHPVPDVLVRRHSGALRFAAIVLLLVMAAAGALGAADMALATGASTSAPAPSSIDDAHVTAAPGVLATVRTRAERRTTTTPVVAAGAGTTTTRPASSQPDRTNAHASRPPGRAPPHRTA